MSLSQQMNIEFIPSSQAVSDLVEPPVLSKESVPEWYRSIPSFYNNTEKVFGNNGELKNTNVKMCMPFLDALTGGFVQKTWCDIYITDSDEGLRYNWSQNPQIMAHRDNVHINLGQDNFYNVEFHWMIPWIPKTPKGYSVLMTHPHNRLDLPFYTLSGIVDSDDFHHIGFGQYPFYIKKGFQGLIPAGTPMYQIIPIKRDNWTSIDLEYQEKEQKKKSFSILKNYWGAYRDRFWKKKIYTRGKNES